MDTLAQCEAICEEFAGSHYRTPAFRRACNAVNWDGLWPVIDRDGDLTGAVVDSEAGYLNVDDDAMIAIGEAKAGRWQLLDDGYAAEPKVLDIEVSATNETIAGVIDVDRDDHHCVERACEAYRSAVIEFLDRDPRAKYLNADRPKGSRILHSQWAGAHFSYSAGAIGVMSDSLTVTERDVIDAADEAGRQAAAKVVEMFTDAEGS